MKKPVIPMYAERFLKIDSVNLFQSRIWPLIQDRADEFNFSGNAQNDILDWCVVEIYKGAFEICDIRIANHYRYDEGKLILDELPKPMVVSFETMIVPKYRNYPNSKAKIMISGTNALVSIERNS